MWRVKSLEATQIICILDPFLHWTRIVCNLVCTSLSEAWGIASSKLNFYKVLQSPAEEVSWRMFCAWLQVRNFTNWSNQMTHWIFWVHRSKLQVAYTFSKGGDQLQTSNQQQLSSTSSTTYEPALWAVVDYYLPALWAALHSIELPVIQELLPLACDPATTELLHGVFVVLMNLFQYATGTGMFSVSRCFGRRQVMLRMHRSSWSGESLPQQIMVWSFWCRSYQLRKGSDAWMQISWQFMRERESLPGSWAGASFSGNPGGM